MENRRDKRFRQWNKVALRESAGAEGRPEPTINAYTFDISLKGARIQSDKGFAKGSLVRLQIELVRTRETIRVDAEVKWSRWNPAEEVFEMGVEFLHELSHTIMALFKDLYGEPTGLPASMQPAPGAGP
jgi:hypothetical protein